MADDILNEGSDQDENASKDDDFGLPDLEFDDLQELDMSGDDADDSNDDGAAEAAPVDDSPVDFSADSVSQEFDMSLVEGLTSDEPDLGSGLQEGDLDPPEAESVLDEGIDEVEDVLDSAQLISDRLGESEGDSSPIMGEDTTGINYDELMGDTASEDSLFSADEPAPATEEPAASEDLFADIDSPDDLAALGFADEDTNDSGPAVEEPAAVESDSLFGNDSPVEDDGDSIFGADTSLALESEEKIEFDSSDEGALPPNYKSYTYEESSGGFTKFIVIGVVGIAAVAGVLLWMSRQEGGEDVAKAKTEKVIPKKNTKKKPAEKSAEKASTSTAEKGEDKKATTAANNNSRPKTKAKTEKAKPKPKPKPEALATASSAEPGEIIRVAERTSLSYVIVASFIDEDMAMDYAVELSGAGNGVKIIEPYGKSKRYRVSIADFPTYGDAANQLAEFKPEYGEDVWALKY